METTRSFELSIFLAQLLPLFQKTSFFNPHLKSAQGRSRRENRKRNRTVYSFQQAFSLTLRLGGETPKFLASELKTSLPTQISSHLSFNKIST
jgi:hypothetical protein